MDMVTVSLLDARRLERGTRRERSPFAASPLEAQGLAGQELIILGSWVRAPPALPAAGAPSGSPRTPQSSSSSQSRAGERGTTVVTGTLRTGWGHGCQDRGRGAAGHRPRRAD